MSDGPSHHGPSESGGSSKWVLGGVTALLLLGGGYFVWKGATRTPDNAEIAATDPYAEESLRAEAVGPAADPLADSAGPSAAPAAAEPPAPPRRRAAPPAAIPEETIGITPTSAEVAEAENSEEIVVTAPRRPIWARTPSPRRLSALYPERALERGREGEARLHCIVEPGGTLDCERMSESSAGFGAAALRVARSFRHAPTLSDGTDATGSPVRLRVVFRMADEDRRS